QRLLGGDLAIRTLYQGLSEDQLDYLERSSETVSHFAEMRSMVRQTDGDSTLVELKAVDTAYPLFGTVRLEGERELQDALDKRGGVWGTVIEPTLLDRLQVQPGERLLLGEQEYEIRGVIREEPDRVGWSGTFGLGPRMMVALDSLPGTGLVQKGSLVYQHYRLRLPPGTDLGRYQSALNAAFPEANWRLRDYREAAPRIQRVVDRLTLFLTLVGLTALLVGGVGISNAVRAYLDNKLAVIATLKCVGAPGRTVFQTYMAQILILAAGGIGIGLIVGAAAPLLAGRLLQDWLPFAVQMGLYPGALLLAAVFGLLTTLSFAIWPLARAHGIPAGALFRSTVEPARSRPKTSYILATALSGLLLSGLAVASAEHRPFAAWFVIGAIAAMLAFRAAAWGVMAVTARLRRPRHPGLRLAVSNLHRPGSPTPSVVLSLGLGLSVLVAIVLIEGNMGRQIQDSIPERAPSFFFIDIQRDQIEPFTELVSGLEGVRDVQRVPYLRGRILAINGVPAEQAMVDRDHEWMIRGDRGLTYSATRPENAEIVAGEWWSEDYAGPPLLSIHQ
ncbi:MAG: FtsX-like permease family protein, partial [Candidatus Competibacterales bacterium]|nr:FtsX-like permease family protein [Candidatus Competibacterales bacterium]